MKFSPSAFILGFAATLIVAGIYFKPLAPLVDQEPKEAVVCAK